MEPLSALADAMLERASIREWRVLSSNRLPRYLAIGQRYMSVLRSLDVQKGDFSPSDLDDSARSLYFTLGYRCEIYFGRCSIDTEGIEESMLLLRTLIPPSKVSTSGP